MVQTRAIKDACRAFRDDERGSLTLEFVLWIPLLSFWAVFSLAVYQAMDNRSDAAKATYTISDIMSRYSEIDRSDMQQLELLINELLPGASAGARLRFSSIEYKDEKYTVLWTECFGPIGSLTDAGIPVDLIPTMEEGETVILTETYVPYLPIFDVGGLEPFVWSTAIVTRPRFNAKVEPALGSQIDTDCANDGGGGGSGDQSGPPLSNI